MPARVGDECTVLRVSCSARGRPEVSTRLTRVIPTSIPMLTLGTVALIVAAAAVLIAALVVVVRILTEKRRSD